MSPFRKANPAAALLLPALLMSCGSGGGRKDSIGSAGVSKGPFERIVSFSPGTTEILFVLGLGGKVVGVTRFCTYPPETEGIPKVGGYLDPGYEAAVMLKPDIVLLLPEQERTAAHLGRLGIRTLTVDNKRISDILSAIDTIGSVFGIDDRADSVVESLRSRMESIANPRPGDAVKPRVLVSIGHEFGSGLRGVYAAGGGTYIGEILEMAGGVNACSGAHVKYPEISREGIISMDPDIILELVPPGASDGIDADAIRGEWMSLSSVKAVDSGKVFILECDYAQIPGPRFIDLMEDFARIIRRERG